LQRNRKEIAVYPYILIVLQEMTAITKKTAAGFAKMLGEVQVLTVEQLATLSVAVVTLLQEKLESGAKPAKKAAPKAAAAAAASDEEEAEPKAVSPHLAYNRFWITHVTAYAKEYGWDTPFLKKVTPRGCESYMEQKSESTLTSVGHVYADTQQAPMKADFMSLAKHWRDTDHAVWEAYVKVNPLPVTAPKVKKVIAVKAAPVVKAAAAATAAATTVVPPKVAPKKLPAAAAAAAAVTVVAVPVPMIAKPRGSPAVKPAAKVAVKPAEPAWVCPLDGMGIWVMDGNQYIRDAEDLVWTVAMDADGIAHHGDWCGKWDENTQLFDKTVEDPRLKMAKEEDE
jgi:hypothetical protein